MKKPLFLTLIIILVLIVAAGFFLGWKYYLKPDNNKKTVIQPSAADSSDIQTGAKYVEGLEKIQDAVNKGEDQFYLDPVGAARYEGLQYGFTKDDEFLFVDSNYAPPEHTNLATVEARHNGKSFSIILLQPEKVGEGGIWSIASVEESIQF